MTTPLTPSPTESSAIPARQAHLIAWDTGIALVLGFLTRRQFRRISLQTKLVVASLIISMVPLAILGYVSYVATRQALVNAANESLAGAAVQTAANLDGFIQANLDAVRTEAQLPYFGEYLDTPNQQWAASAKLDGNAVQIANTLLALSRRNQLYISSYALLDQNGIDVIDTFTPDAGVDQSDRDYFRVPVATGLPYVSPVEVSQAGDQSSIYFSAPVRDIDGKIVGVLRIRYKAAVLQQIVTNADGLAGEQSFAVLLDENHMRLADGSMPELNFKTVMPLDLDKIAALQSTDRLPSLPTDQLSTNLPDFEQGLTNAASNPFFRAELQDNEDSSLEAATIASLTNEPWLVVFAQTEEVFLAPVETQTRNALFISAIIAAMIALATTGLAQRLMGPIVRLIVVAEKVGTGDLGIQAQAETNDEIGKLATTFNTMTSQLRHTMEGLAERTQELDQANKQLEIDITERKQAEAKFRALVEQLPAVTYVASLEDQCTTVYISPQIEAVLGFTPEEWLADPDLWSKQIHPDDRERVLAADERAHTTGEPFISEYRIFARDGHVVWFHDESRWVYDENGKPRFTQGIDFDITERKRGEAALQESEERYALAVRSANDGLWDWNLKTDDVYFSPRWKSMLGYQENEIDHSPDDWFKHIHPDDLLRVKADLASHLEGQASHLESEYRMRHVDGGYRWILTRGLAVRDATGHATRVAGSQSDITARKLAVERLAHDAMHDGLTGLPNRTLFLDRLDHAIKRTKRPGDKEHLFAALFLDIDRFKLVNDSLGHAFGDQLLIEIGERLKTCLRLADTVARLGGDEFVILLEDMVDAADATHIANRIQSALSSPFHLGGHQLTTTASIGIAMSSANYDRAEDLLRDADTAMYRAKTTGKARQEIFDTGMHAAVSSLLQLEADLRQAIEKQEFQVYYQPLVSTASGGIVGTEALLRWQHPTRGLLPPAAFITVLEETGMIIPAGEWILRAACLQNKAWQASGYPHLRVAVNFSARQFHIKNLAEMVKSVLNETGMDPATLELEITESTAMKDADLTLQTLNELHAMGVGISLDDFGSGYSALGYLNKYPFQSLKADRSFIMDIPNDSNDTAITAAIIAMAHSLKLRVVAEGVETQEQLDFLQSQKCDELQGFLFSRPIPAEELNKLLQKKSLFPVRRAEGNGKPLPLSLLKTKK